jgi:hypothetical protein
MVGMSGGTAHQINYWRPTTGVSCVAVQSALRLTVLATFRSKAMATIPAAQREYQTCTSVPWRFARHRSIHWKEPEESWGTFRGNLFKRGWLSLEESTTSGTHSVAAGSTSTKGPETSLGPFFSGVLQQWRRWLHRRLRQAPEFRLPRHEYGRAVPVAAHGTQQARAPLLELNHHHRALR